eukprot:gene7891-32588_t
MKEDGEEDGEKWREGMKEEGVEKELHPHSTKATEQTDVSFEGLSDSMHDLWRVVGRRD